MKFKNWWLGPIGILYDVIKHNDQQRDKRTQMLIDAQKANSEKKLDKAQTIYNYGLDDSITGNTLFNSQQKPKRTIFGNGGTLTNGNV